MLILTFFYLAMAVASLATCVIFMRKQRARIPDGQVSHEPLDPRETFLTWVVCFFAPVVCGAILYYGWLKKLPEKAKRANRISWICFGLIVAIRVVIGLLESNMQGGY